MWLAVAVGGVRRVGGGVGFGWLLRWAGGRSGSWRGWLLRCGGVRMAAGGGAGT